MTPNNKKQKSANIIIRILADKRFLILTALGTALYLLISRFDISLWYVLLAGALLGVVFGKVFCRWMCPIGLLMEFLMNLSPDNKTSHMYQYHKLGCPIAWVSGWLNKYSLFQIKVNQDTCKSCGICDKECYIVGMEPVFYSLYKKDKDNPAQKYSCSKCLKCVAVCPNGSLSYK